MTKAAQVALPILFLCACVLAAQDASPPATAPTKQAAPQSKPVPKRTLPQENDGSTRVVRNGGAKDPPVNFTPANPPEEVKRRTDGVNDLLNKTDANLKSLSGQTLSSAQQDTAAQITMYSKQARAALADGDLDRAENLANKANVLSADLAGKP